MPYSIPTVTNSQRTIPLSLSSTENVLRFLLKKSGHSTVSLHFVGKKKIASLHKTYFDDPTPTDCITFPYDDPDFFGEIFVCPLVAKEYIQIHGGNVYDEITLYVVHGFCHLLGFDDQTPSQQNKMRQEEKKWLQLLAKNNLAITP